MRVGELLKELRSNQLRDQSDQVAGSASDQLWTDETLVRYINQAQNKFAMLTECIRDATTPGVTEVNVTVGNSQFPLHEKVVAVLSARYPGDTADLTRTGHSAFNQYRPADQFYFDPAVLTTMPPGKPLAWSTDEGMSEDDKGSFNAIIFRTYPEVGPTHAATIKLRVVRMPLIQLTTDDLDRRLEIPERYHMDILDWAGYLALRGPDLDVAGGDGFARAMDLRKSFMNTVEDCKRDMKRRMFTPLQWGFGRRGFSWERD